LYLVAHGSRVGAGCYPPAALIAVINAVVIATSERRTEFAVARVTGLSRRQVLRTALVESWAVTTIALLLAGVAAGGSLLGIRASIERGSVAFDLGVVLRDDAVVVRGTERASRWRRVRRGSRWCALVGLVTVPG
jgi:predicted lysophospholipase L1 biosynthesis ABC-type transport system permease subunit